MDVALLKWSQGRHHFHLQNCVDYREFKMTSFQEYDIIAKHYDSKTTQRSGIPLMNHIDEGLYVLGKISATEEAQRAYCLHPIFQSDEDLLKNIGNDEILRKLDPKVLINVMEYRSVANAYLSKRKINSLDEIRLSPLKDVNDMLIADKIQNRKDFELYHKDTHQRSAELTNYFSNWMVKLGITEDFYSDMFLALTNWHN